jgi:hypothetical protein
LLPKNCVVNLKMLSSFVKISLTYFQCCGSESAWIRNFLSDLDPELEVSNPDPGQSPKLDGKMYKNHKKMN